MITEAIVYLNKHTLSYLTHMSLLDSRFNLQCLFYNIILFPWQQLSWYIKQRKMTSADLPCSEGAGFEIGKLELKRKQLKNRNKDEKSEIHFITYPWLGAECIY